MPLVDPFPNLQGEDYLLAFWPWLLANAEIWPGWAVEYALLIGGLSARDASRLARRRVLAVSARGLKTPQDLIELLNEQMQEVRSDPVAGTLDKARALAYLAGVARKAIETGVLSDRLEALENFFQSREGANPQ
jgi:hypothetical protein